MVVLGIIPYHALVIFGASSAVYIKSAQSNPVLGLIGGFLLTWGIPTLFLLAGAACRLAVERHGPGTYMRERLTKLLVPMVLVALVFSPLQAYFILLSNPSLVTMSPVPIQNPEQLANFGTFYRTYLTLLVTTVRQYSPAIGTLALAHMWFIPRLLIVSLVVLALVRIARRYRARARLLVAGIDHHASLFLFGGGLVTAVIVALLRPGWLERLTAGLPFTDVWSEFALDLAVFLCGYLIYTSGRLHAAVRKLCFVTLGIGLGCWAVVAAVTISGKAPAATFAPVALAYTASWALAAWMISLTLLGLAMRYLTVSTPSQRYLTYAAFPVYLLHMPLLTVSAYYMLKLSLPWYLQLPLITGVTVIGAFGVFELVVLRTPITRLLFGVTRQGPTGRSSATPVPQQPAQAQATDQAAPVPARTAGIAATQKGGVAMNLSNETNLALLFRDRSERYAHAVRWRQSCGESWRAVTYEGQRRLVNQIISGLDALGAAPGDAIGILSGTRWEWIVSDWAITGLGGVTTTIYPTLPQEAIVLLLRDSGVRYLFIEDASQYLKLRDVLDDLPELRRLMLFDESTTPLAEARVLSFAALLSLSVRSPEEADAFAEACAQRIQPDDEASLIYTSGTTGQPKGVLHTHRTLLAQIAGAGALLDTVHPGMVDALFLPLSHVLGRLEHLFALERGAETVILPSLDHLAQDVAAAHPDILLGVPRLYEKAYAAVMARAATESALKRAVFRWSERVGRASVPYRQQRRGIPLALRAQLAVADALVFRQIRTALGGRLQFALSGGAPLDPSIIAFFHAIGIPLLEGWGLTETGGAFTVNQLDAFRVGSVGRPFPGHEARIAGDGEVLVRGPCLFVRYHNQPLATAEAIDAEGWFRTGDVGTLDSDGFLRIVDRKKELIVTAGGKKVAPQRVESLLKGDPLVSQACVYGDRKPYLVALLTLDWAAVARWAEERQVVYSGARAPIDSAKLLAHLDAHVAGVNAQLARFEQVKYYDVLPDDFTVDNGLLTPTLKIRRKAVNARYHGQFEALYRVAGVGAVTPTTATDERATASASPSTVS
jgi:long-chain acyl-CoA synthetase